MTKLSERLKEIKSLNETQIITYLLPEIEALEKQVRDQKPKRFFRTSERTINHLDINEIKNHSFPPSDMNRYCKWIESWGVDSPESEK